MTVTTPTAVDLTGAPTDTPTLDIHPVHGEFDCAQAEASARRAWEKVNTLTERTITLDEMLAEARRDLAAARTDADAHAEQVTTLTEVLLSTETTLTETADALTAAQARTDDAALVPDLAAAATASWRRLRPTGQVPKRWRDHLDTPEARARLAAALDTALAAALDTERDNLVENQ
jgi:hypothetical protein